MSKRRLSDDSFSDDSSETYSLPKPKRRSANKKSKIIDSDDDEYVEVASTGLANVTTGLRGHSHKSSKHRVSSPTSIRGTLLEWYSRVHETRGMPWRKPYDASLGPHERAQRAYEVWISEIMLQQTQVATVKPYYQRWMNKFPTIRDLAVSDIETVNSLWKGLGYYSRAARLLKGAQIAVSDFNGRLPDNSKDMQAKIPGIGRYSAGAICSIAYNQCEPVLDGNVTRLLSRFLAMHASPKSKAALDILWAGASALVNGCDRPGDLNQALIELGSTVCKVREPLCTDCPLKPWCQAYQGFQKPKAIAKETEVSDIEDICGICEPLPERSPVTSYPLKVEKKKAREELDIVNVVEWRSNASDNRMFLLVQRPESGLLAGLFEFPTLPNVSRDGTDMTEIPSTLLSTILDAPLLPYAQIRKATSTKALNQGGDALRIAKITLVGDVLHVFSHIKKTYRVQWVILEGGKQPPKIQELKSMVNSPKRDKPNRGDNIDGKTKQPKGGKGARGRQDREQGQPTSAVWIQLGEVADANIGTGVMKIWSLTQSLWNNVS